ncbi:LAME_0E04434g1_1 [Lachancea meyersii CBS 8951]|uniref:LAME_0E04434g1_1 n=1 Tax=Lachancea meyersii CBS 8951 TaxID=1266667 RepID=A0A1G4JGW4_9SACH|nr:LAME_0E04434g1_1 [Lachancea meyersii CBS 8951]
MGILNAPGIIRVKRKREEDSIQALLLQENESAKRGRFVFKLAKTVETGSDVQNQELETPLLKLSNVGNARHFVLEQRKRKHEAQELPVEISEMLNNYLSLAPSKTAEITKLKRPNRRKSGPEVKPESLPSLSYVYDIYYREVVPEDEFVFDPSTIGYIRIVEDSGDLLAEDDDDDRSEVFSDDQDSNEESFYQNDYPEDEDDDRSVLFGSEADLEVRRNEDDGSEESEAEQLEADTIRNHIVASLGDDETDALFERYAEAPDLLKTAGANYFDLDDDDHDDESSELESDDGNDAGNHKRHIFFPSDAEDPMAMHRDKIFGKLENMISKR